LSALWFEDESSGQENMVNIWFADSKGGGGRIEEVRSWNPEAPGFKLAKHLILAERDEAIRLAQEMIDSGELRLQEIYGWPILKNIREELIISKWE